MSRIGNKSIAHPRQGQDQRRATDGVVAVEGPKGKLEYTLPRAITANGGRQPSSR